MEDIYKSWVDFGIDGFRIDTMKHVNAEFWDEFAPAILQAAQGVSKPDFFSFGEVFSGNEQLLSFYTTSGEVQAVLDFKFQEQVGGYVASGGSAKGLQEMFQKDDYFTDDDSNVYALPTFLGNHDRGRFAWFVQNGRAGATAGLRRRAAAAVEELLAAVGDRPALGREGLTGLGDAGRVAAFVRTCAAAEQPFGAGPNKCCLLYTSPSPRDRTRSRMPTSA